MDWVFILEIIGVCVFGLLALFKVLRIIRPPKNVKVNCWFCNQDCKVPSGNENCFHCPHCDQYNGFDQFGNYNKAIPAQCNEEFNHYSSIGRKGDEGKAPSPSMSEGVLCQECTINQTVKVQQLAAFVPYNESNFDAEAEYFERYLENLYPLCDMCEGAVHRVLRHQDQHLKMKLIGRWLQHSRPSSPTAPSSVSTPPVPFYIMLLRLIAVISAAMCLTIDLHQEKVIDVKAALQDIITEIPAIGQQRSSILLAGLVCVIFTALLAGKNRLRHIDAILPLVWLLNLSIKWAPSWLTLPQVPQFITQLPWIHKASSWLPWEFIWPLGVSISCLICSLVFLISNKEVVKQRKFKRSESFNNLRSASLRSSAVSRDSSIVSDEPPYQPNDVSMLSDHMTPPKPTNHSMMSDHMSPLNPTNHHMMSNHMIKPTNHDRHELGDSLYTLSLGPPSGQKKKRNDIWTAYTPSASSCNSHSAYQTEPITPHFVNNSHHSLWTSKLLRTLSSFCIIILRLLAVLSIVCCLLIDMQRHDIIDVKRVFNPSSDFPSIGKYRNHFASFGLVCFSVASLIAWITRLRHTGAFAVVLCVLNLMSVRTAPFLPSLHIPQAIVQLPFLHHIYIWLPWAIIWQILVSTCCLFFSGAVLLSNGREIARRRREESQISTHNTLEDTASSASSVSSESLHNHHFGNDVSMVSNHMTPPDTPNRDRPVLGDCLNTLPLRLPTGLNKKKKDIWTSHTCFQRSSLNHSFKPSVASTYHQRRPLIQPAKFNNVTSRSRVTKGQLEHSLLSPRNSRTVIQN